jgi:hypothetical protein
MRFYAFLFSLALDFIVSSAFGAYLQISAGKGVYPLRLKAGIIDLAYRFRSHFEPTADGIEDTHATIAIQDASGTYLFRETPNSLAPAWFHGTFSNPKEQTVYVWAKGGFILLPPGKGGLYRALDDGTSFSGDAVVSGTNDSPTPPSPPAQAAAPVPTPRTAAQIHALIISGQSNVASVVRGKAQVTGGLIALGRAAQAAQSWDPGVQIIPDPELLNGSKIPPVTPNLIDVRIVRFSMSARFQDTQSNDK